MPATATKTDPALWERAKEEAKSRMGGKHSARAMQLAVQIYKKKGGGYSGAKPTASSNSLKKWTKQKWQWTGKDKPGQGGTGVYLPEAKADRLKSTEEGRKKLRAASAKKREATRRGEQYSSHGLAAGTSLKKASIPPHTSRKKTQSAVKRALVRFARAHGIDPEKAMLVAGGAAYMHGMRDDINDIDFFHEDLKDFVKHKQGRFDLDGGPGAQLNPHATEWEMIGGMRVQTPRGMLAFYEHLNRPKDQEKIRQLRLLVGGLQTQESTKKASMPLHPAIIKAAASAPKKLKVIYIDETGAGHRSQANNIVDAAKRMGVDAEAVDFSRTFMHPKTHQERSGALRKTFVDYLNAKGSIPSSLRLGLEVGKFHRGVDKARINRFVAKNRDAQIAFAHPHVEHHFTHVDRPMSVIHTDPAPWPLYFRGRTKAERVHIGAGTSTKGIENSVAVSGIPVAPKLLQKRFKKSGLLSPGKFHITVSGGGEAVEVPEMVEHVLKSNLPRNAQIHAVAGRRADVLEKLQQIAARDPRVKAHGFAPLPSMMREANLNVIRSHGTSFAETLAAGKPAVYYGPKASLDLQGGLTRHTALHAGERTGHPVAVGLDQLPHAINQARKNYRSHAARAVQLRQEYGDPAKEIARAAMNVGMPKKERS